MKPANLEYPRQPLNADTQGEHSFAYKTIRDRMPVIVTQTVDSLCRFMQVCDDTDVKQLGKQAVAELSRLRYQMQCNKPFEVLVDDMEDLEVWNHQVTQYVDQNLTWFSAPWLFAECYMYRRIQTCMLLLQSVCKYDQFGESKRNSFMSHRDQCLVVAEEYRELVASSTDPQTQFSALVQVDLSLLAGKSALEMKEYHDGNSSTRQDSLLVDDSIKCWKHITTNSLDCIHIVLDNAGMELFGDLILADWLVVGKFCKRVVLHCKQFPWFVSDVTPMDIQWLLDGQLAKDFIWLHERLSRHFANGTWQVEAHPFWTTHYPMACMKAVAHDLHQKLAAPHQLSIFKGDLNYRKLLYDCQWEQDLPFADALNQSLREMSVLALRTCKSDIVCGLARDIIYKLNTKYPAAHKGESPAWQVNGKYGLIQFCQQLTKQ